MAKALVAGALGIMGRTIVKELEARGWETVGVSRRGATDTARTRYLSIDLLSPSECRALLAAQGDVTHVFYAAFQDAPTWPEATATNRAMLVNLIEALEPAAPRLERVVLVTGTKYYGTHLGPLKTPFRESDPRHMPPNFYFEQADFLIARQKGKRWSWTELRPQTLCGISPGTPMSIVTIIATYAAIAKELGLPLRFPGKPGAYTALYQVTDSEHFARAALWAASEKACANEAFNVTNGDLFRWQYLWPSFARDFGMELAPPQPTPLVQYMADKGNLWDSMVAKYGLQPYPLDALASWRFGDYVFATDWDVISSLTKSRQGGFHDIVDSEAMFLRLFRQLREERIIPP
jgi:nucleoside-diphosphate-sugar epimerase